MNSFIQINYLLAPVQQQHVPPGSRHGSGPGQGTGRGEQRDDRGEVREEGQGPGHRGGDGVICIVIGILHFLNPQQFCSL